MRTSNLFVCAGALAGVAACGGGSAKPATIPGDGTVYPVPALPGEVTCWHGTGGVEFVTGQEQGQIDMYVRRGYDAGAGTVTEDALSVVKGAASRSWQTLAIDGGALTVAGKYKGGTFSGTGSAEGAAPAWSRWVVDTTLDVGPQVHSEYTAQGAGLEAVSVVADGNGNAMMRFTVQLAAMDLASCDAAYSHVEPL
ncbi:MAG: hypothetical protein H6709_13200 [Kofleriaceae bacterium]|nr:hypothetical protein [Myxococcales bacterium]MCB9573034.1 hypothetical protein [Kofleriaceae bacterium]